MAYTGLNPRVTSSILTDLLATTPSSPKSGSNKLINRNGSLFLMDSTGAETPVGGGAGEKNYILSPSTATGWVASGAGITVAVDTTAAELPRALTTKTGIKITGVSGSTAYAYYRFTLDAADYNRALKIKFDLMPVSGYVSSDFKVDIYSNTASNYGGSSTRLVTSSDASAICAIPSLTGSFQTKFTAPDSSAPYMELRIGLNGTNTHACVFSDIVVGPGVIPQGAVIGPWLAYTPANGSWTANTTYTGFYRQVGSTMEISLKAATSGAPTSTNLTVKIPTGFTIDTSVLTATGGGLGSILGAGIANDSDTTAYRISAAYNTTTSVAIVYQSNASGLQSNVTQAAPFTFGAGDSIDIKFSVPIAEWAGSGVVNVVQNDVEYASNSSTTDANDTTSFAYGPSGSVVPTVASSAVATSRDKTVAFQTPIQSTDLIVLEIQESGTGAWIPHNDSQGYQSYTRLGGTSYGISWAYATANTVKVSFYQGGRIASNATYALAGAAMPWNATDRYRLKKISGGQAVGFGNVAQNVSGLVKSAGQLLGTNTNDVAATGYIGERIFASVASGSAIAAGSTGADKTITSIGLPSGGQYEIKAAAYYICSAATSVTSKVVGISLTTNSLGSGVRGVPSLTGEWWTLDQMAAMVPVGTVSIVLPGTIVSVAAATTIYLIGELTYTLGTGVTMYGFIEAVRVR